MHGLDWDEMKVKYGKGKTEYGPGVSIELTGNDVAIAIDAYLVAHRIHVDGSRTITVNAIAPGFIHTDIWSTVPEDAQESLMDIIPLGRVGQPEEIAKAAAFLASDDAAYITGHILTVDGGIAM